MFLPCEECGWEDTVDYDRDFTWAGQEPTCFVCSNCGARYEIEADADYDDGWIDCSTTGARIPGPLKESFERYVGEEA